MEHRVSTTETGRPGLASIPDGYAEHAPPPDLAAWVVCAWTRLLPESVNEAVHRVVPDGCTDILFGFGRAEGRRAEAPRGRDLTEVSVVGSMTKPVLVQGPQPRFLVGVRLAPGFAHAAFGVPAHSVADQRVDYRLVCGDGNADIDVVSAATSDGQRVAAAFDLVRRRLARGAAVPRSVRAAVRRIASVQGNLRVEPLADEMGLTRQQLARQFATHVGVSPKLFARVMRTQAALARADAARAAYPRGVDWSAIAHDLGYYDQPHFIDDFKSLTGSTPGDWIR
jgi:AraC-like DNA-binding protein